MISVGTQLNPLDETIITDEQLWFNEQLAKGTQFAMRLSQNLLPSQGKTKSLKIPNSEWVIDPSVLQEEDCLVYSFGIGKNDTYTNYMAQQGCQVFAFDPTQYEYSFPGVQFYSWGIRNYHNSSNNNNNNHNWSHPTYGTITGELKTLPEIVTQLGHTGRRIHALKFDCEGCEYGAFRDILEYERLTGKPFNAIGSLSTEFHFSTTLGIQSKQDVANMHFAEAFLKHQDCQVIHYKPNRGFARDRNVFPYLLNHGVQQGICCYEYGFTCNQ
jgi:hypothetical protein